MKKLLLLITLFIAASATVASAEDHLDSLKQRLQIVRNDTLKGGIYKQIAFEYLNKYDTIKHSGVKRYYQGEALNYSLLALRNYSFYEDTLGMRTCFDYLARVYQSQGKYSQAKWFLLQSKDISRKYKDNPALIGTLVKLANVKMAAKDYKLAMKDLNDAEAIAVKNKLPKFEAFVQQNYGYLYNRMDDPEKGEIAAKRAAEIYDNVKHDEELKVLAAQMGQDTSLKAKKTLISKKKIYAAGRKKTSKVTAAKAARLASL